MRVQCETGKHVTPAHLPLSSLQLDKFWTYDCFFNIVGLSELGGQMLDELVPLLLGGVLSVQVEAPPPIAVMSCHFRLLLPTHSAWRQPGM